MRHLQLVSHRLRVGEWHQTTAQTHRHTDAHIRPCSVAVAPVVSVSFVMNIVQKYTINEKAVNCQK